MFGGLKHIIEQIKNISKSIDKYKRDTIVQSLPTLTYVNRAKKYIESNDYLRAENILLEALSLPQKDALVHKYLGLVYERTGKYNLAADNYQIAADLNPHDKNIWQRLGFALLSLKKYEKAVKAFENANRIQAGNTDTFTGWGMALMKLKDYSEAREKFIQAIKINKYNFSAMFLCSIMEIKLEMYDKAENRLTFLANVCPNESNTFEYARLKALKNNTDDAIHYAKKSLEYNPRMLPAYILLGQLYTNILDKENALKYFEEAEKQNFESANLYIEWGKSLEKFEMYDDAKIKLLKACELEPNNMEANSHLGLCCVSRKEFEEAEPILQKVLEKDPENKVVKQALGIIAYEHQETDKAIQIFRADDEDAINCFYLAKCYQRQGNDTKTRDYYEAALLHNNKYITAYVNYIDYLMSKEDYADAQRKLRKALKFEPKNADLLNLMFYVSYILVKDNIYEYNLKETISMAEQIENMGEDLFKYPEQKQELINLLQKRDKN